MKLVSFRVQTPVGAFIRAGALSGETVVDLNMAYARLLADQHEPQPYRMANAAVPATMLELLEGGASALRRAREAFNYATRFGDSVSGPEEECVVYSRENIRVVAPLPNPIWREAP